MNLGKVLRTKSNNNIPSNSTLDKKNSNYFGKITNNLNNNININYELSLNHDLDEIQYTSNLETENNPTNPDAGKSDKIVKAEASYKNGLFIYDLFPSS